MEDNKNQETLGESRTDDPGGTDRASPGSRSPKGGEEMAIPGPVFFLIREQAKSLLAIKELQQRVQALEGFRNDIIYAIQDIQHQMYTNMSQDHSVPRRYPASATEGCQNSKTSPVQKTHVSWGSHAKSKQSYALSASSDSSGIGRTKMSTTSNETCDTMKRASLSANVNSAKGETVMMESDKQDSGLDSDCRENGGLSSGGPPESLASRDELLDLLDVIGQKGTLLRKQLDEMEQIKRSVAMDASTSDPSVEIVSAPEHKVKMQIQNLELKKHISQLEEERGRYKNTIRHLQLASHRLEGEKMALEDKLQSTIFEKQQLERKIHDLHMQFVKGSNSLVSAAKAESWPADHIKKPVLNSELERLKTASKGLQSEESRAKVSAVLKETSVIDLQRQLLMYIMENESLQYKLEQLDQTWYGKFAEWKTAEAALNSELHTLRLERDECLQSLKNSRMEMTALQAKVRVLEMTLHSVSQEQMDYPKPQDVSQWLNISQRLVQSYHPGFTDYGDLHFRAQSLPPVLNAQADNSQLVGENGNVLNNSSFVDISADDCLIPHNEGMAYDSDDPHRPVPFSSTPFSSPKKLFRTPWKMDSPHRLPTIVSEPRLMDLEDEDTDGDGPRSNLEVICNEFDPLSAGESHKQNIPKPMEFVDSLDLSVPLKPVKTGVSSISLDAKYLSGTRSTKLIQGTLQTNKSVLNLS